MVIRRIRPISLARLAGVMYAVMGLILGGIFALVTSVSGLSSDVLRGSPLAPVVGVAAVVALPIFYGCLGFVVFLLAALLYNAIAGVTGGIEFETDPSAGS